MCKNCLNCKKMSKEKAKKKPKVAPIQTLDDGEDRPKQKPPEE